MATKIIKKRKGVILDFCAENPMGIIRKSSPIRMFAYKARSTEDVFQWIGELIRKQHRDIFYYPWQISHMNSGQAKFQSYEKYDQVWGLYHKIRSSMHTRGESSRSLWGFSISDFSSSEIVENKRRTF